MVEMGRVAVLRKLGGPVEIEEYPVPDPEAGGMVLKMQKAGVCGSDLNIMRGLGGLPSGSRVMGHEGYGSVFKLGANVRTDFAGNPIEEGDRVVHSGVEPCYRCFYCGKGEYAWCASYVPSRQAAGEYPYFLGTFSDFLYVDSRRPVFKVPESVPDGVLTFLNCALGTVTDPLLRLRPSPDDLAVVFGAGGLGLTAVGMLRVLGVRNVVSLDRQEERLVVAKSMGATHRINVAELDDQSERLERIEALTDGRGADLVIDCVGRADIMEEGLAMLANGGTFLQIGLTKPDDVATIVPISLLRGKSIRGSIMYRPSVLPMLLNLLKEPDGLPPFDALVTRSYPLDEVNIALSEMEWRAHGNLPARACLVP